MLYGGKNMNRDRFIKEGMAYLEEIYQMVQEEKKLDFSELDIEKTVVFFVDVNNGFLKEGNLSSEEVAKALPSILKLSQNAHELGIDRLAITDSHEVDAIEFESYPKHCITGTKESQVVEELMIPSEIPILPKNSTNAFVASSFQNWLQENAFKDTFIFAGDCTDICVLQMALTLKAYYNENNKPSRIIVPMDCVSTFDAPGHSAQVYQGIALQFMKNAGIQVVSTIKK